MLTENISSDLQLGISKEMGEVLQYVYVNSQSYITTETKVHNSTLHKHILKPFCG